MFDRHRVVWQIVTCLVCGLGLRGQIAHLPYLEFMHYDSLSVSFVQGPCTLPIAPVSRSFGLRSSYESISLTPTKDPRTNLFDSEDLKTVEKLHSRPLSFFDVDSICPNPSIAAGSSPKQATQSSPFSRQNINNFSYSTLCLTTLSFVPSTRAVSHLTPAPLATISHHHHHHHHQKWRGTQTPTYCGPILPVIPFDSHRSTPR